MSSIAKQFLFLIMVSVSFSVLASSGTDSQKLIKALNDIRNSHNIPAFSFVIVDKSTIVSSASSGVTDLHSNKKLTLDTIIRIGSITKSFTALAILKLQQQGKLNLNDPIKYYIDDLPLKNQWSKTNPVKISHLLEHTAGLLDLSKTEFAFNDSAVKSLKKAFAIEPDSRITKWPPGLHSSYSNVGSGYLGYIIEKVTGTRYETYVTNTILKPLKMDNTGFFLDKKTRQNLATGYDSDGKTTIPYWHMIFRPFGAINTSTRQMASFVQFFLNNGKVNNSQLISENNITRMEIPKTTLAAKIGLNFGYGLANYAHLHNGFVFHGHGGDGDGYLAYYAYNRELGLGYFIVINAFNSNGLYKMRMVVEDYITGNKKKKHTPTIFHHANLKQFVGSYRSVTHRMPWLKPDDAIMNITLENNKLFFNFNSIKKQLIPVKKFIFRFISEPVATQAFSFYSGKMYFQNDDANFIKVDVKPVH